MLVHNLLISKDVLGVTWHLKTVFFSRQFSLVAICELRSHFPAAAGGCSGCLTRLLPQTGIAIRPSGPDVDLLRLDEFRPGSTPRRADLYPQIPPRPLKFATTRRIALRWKRFVGDPSVAPASINPSLYKYGQREQKKQDYTASW